MSARDSASPGPGSSSGLANGGVGGGFGGGSGGYGGVGAGRNGGASSRTGMQTGAAMRGTTAFGRPGGPALGWGMTPQQARNAAAMSAAAAVTRGKPPGAVAPNVMPTSAPPPVGMTPVKSPLTKASMPMFFGGTPFTPAVTDDMIPGFGETYTPPAARSLSAPQPAYSFTGTQQPPVSVYGGLGQATYPAGRQKTITDRVPQEQGFAQSGYSSAKKSF